MPRDHSAEGTRVSSSRKTTVTVYRCEDCETNTCEPLSNKPFVKIGETQSETFSNEIIQLVTNETHIIMCFQQENTFPEGTYVIFWEKDSGAGDACGIPNSGGMLYWEPGYQHMENTFLVMKLNCYVFGQTMRLTNLSELVSFVKKVIKSFTKTNLILSGQTLLKSTLVEIQINICYPDL